MEKKKRNPWAWIPSLYYAEGLPYVVVMIVSVIMYKRLGVSNTEIALYTSWLYLPWVIKPLWSPFVDLLKTKRFWIITMQLVIGAGLAGVALTIPAPNFLKYTLAFMWLLAFSSATHDIAADGFYMLGLSQHDQAWFVGIRSTFYRAAMITGQGLLIILAGYIESSTGLATVSLDVQAHSRATVSATMHPDSLQPATDTAALRLVTVPSTIEINIAPRARAEVDSVLALARRWNSDHGFYPTVESASPSSASETDEPSWWSRNVSQKLEGVLKSWFGPEQGAAAPIGEAGNVGVVYFQLTGPVPSGEQVVVNFGRDAGDVSIRLVEGERFTFTEENWDQPFMAVIQLDPKLEVASQARFEARSGNIPLAWTITFYVLAGFFLLFFFYHRFILPRPDSDVSHEAGSVSSVFKGFVETFVSFFRKKQIIVILAFLLLYRFGEAQLVKLASPFLLDAQEVGGLALTTGQVGFAYGTVGIIALTLGGLIGGFLAARHGLKSWLWPMVVGINIPNAVYVYLAYAMPDSFFIINACIAIEQFGYGFGFTAFLLYTIYVSEGEHKTAHYAICTGFMALGMMVPGMFSGWLQEIIGYQHFFVWVLIATVPGFIVSALIPLDPEFGKKKDDSHEPETT